MNQIAQWNAQNIANNMEYKSTMQAARGPATINVVPQGDIDIISNETTAELMQNNGHLVDIFSKLQAHNDKLEKQLKKLTMYLDEKARDDDRVNLDDSEAEGIDTDEEAKLQARFHIVALPNIGLDSTTGISMAVGDVRKDSDYLKKVQEHKAKMRKFIDMIDSGKQGGNIDAAIKKLEGSADQIIMRIREVHKTAFQNGSNPTTEAILKELNEELLLVQQDIDAAQTAKEMTLDMNKSYGDTSIDPELLKDAEENAKKADFNRALARDIEVQLNKRRVIEHKKSKARKRHRQLRRRERQRRENIRERAARQREYLDN